MKLWHKALATGRMLTSLGSSAGVVVGGTQVIYDGSKDGSKKETALSVSETYQSAL